MSKHGFSLVRFFPVYRPNCMRIVHIRGNVHTVLSIYGKIRIRESPDFGAFHVVTSICLELKENSFVDDQSTKEDN